MLVYGASWKWLFVNPENTICWRGIVPRNAHDLPYVHGIAAHYPGSLHRMACAESKKLLSGMVVIVCR